MDEHKETETVEEVGEEVVEGQEELQVEEEVESKETVIKKIGSKIKDFFQGDEEGAGDDIPEDFTNAAQKAKWLDEDIEFFAAGYQRNEKGEWVDVGSEPLSDEDLIEMIPDLNVETPEKSEVKTELEQEEETQVEDSQEDEKIQKLLDRIDALEKAQGDVNENKERQEQADFAQKASQLFDDVSKEFEVFGKTDKLPKFPDGRLIPNSPQLKARTEVWDVAMSLKQTGMNFDKALKVSLDAYKGKNLANEVKRSVIKGLKKNETRLSGKHTSHESHKIEDYGPDVIREIARRAGKTVN